MSFSLAAAMLAARQILGRDNPDLQAWSRSQWKRWLERQHSAHVRGAGDPLFVFASLTCIDDLSLHIGLMQLLGLPDRRCAVTFTLPTEAMVRLVRAQARREEWHTLVHIIAEDRRDELIVQLPSSSALAVFPHPAMLSDSALADVVGQLGVQSAEAEFWHNGAAYVGTAGRYCQLPAVSATEESILAVLRELQCQSPAHLGPLTDPATVSDSHEPVERRAWPGRVHSEEGRVEIPTARDGGELIVTASPRTEPVVVVRQFTSLHDPAEPMRIKAPASLLTTDPQEIRLEYFRSDEPPIGTCLNFHVPPSQLQPWMLSAFLNRGGAGNQVIRAFAGVGCRIAYAEDEPDMLQEVPVVWGVLRDSDRILAQAKAQSLYFFYIDHAYFNRGHRKTYRITRNRYEAGPVRKCPPDRFRELDLNIEPWRKSGREIIVCPPTEYFMHAHGCPDWLETTLERLRMLTDRPIIVREKPAPGEGVTPLPKALETAHALVTHSSNVAIEAACLGTPVFVAPESAAAPIGRTDLADIEIPAYPDRQEWLAHLAYNQFSFEEIGDGRAWHMLLELEEREFV
jgi:hypothetical protein